MIGRRWFRRISILGPLALIYLFGLWGNSPWWWTPFCLVLAIGGLGYESHWINEQHRLARADADRRERLRLAADADRQNAALLAGRTRAGTYGRFQPPKASA